MSKTSARLVCKSTSGNCPFFLLIHKDGERWSAAKSSLDHLHPLLDDFGDSETDDQASSDDAPARLRHPSAQALHSQIEALRKVRSRPSPFYPLLKYLSTVRASTPPVPLERLLRPNARSLSPPRDRRGPSARLWDLPRAGTCKFPLRVERDEVGGVEGGESRRGSRSCLRFRPRRGG